MSHPCVKFAPLNFDVLHGVAVGPASDVRAAVGGGATFGGFSPL
jgi:hypothetical protein